MTTLVAMDTKSVHGKERVEMATGKPCDDFKNGDHTTNPHPHGAGQGD